MDTTFISLVFLTFFIAIFISWFVIKTLKEGEEALKEIKRGTK